MGTKAFFAIGTNESGSRVHSEIIGMTSDGSQGNLEYLAGEADKLMEKMPDFDPDNKDHVRDLVSKLVAIDPSWLFTDNISNVAWISNSAIYNPIAGRTSIYDGHFGDCLKELETFKIGGQKEKRIFLYVVKRDDSPEGLFTEAFEIGPKGSTFEEMIKNGEESAAKLFAVEVVLEVILTTQEDALDNVLKENLVIKRLRKDEILSHFN